MSLKPNEPAAPVKAIQEGTVIQSIQLSVFDGSLVVVQHPEGITSMYSNLQEQGLIHEGQNVKQGDVIGYARPAWDGLKFYVMSSANEYVNPIQFLAGKIEGSNLYYAQATTERNKLAASGSQNTSEIRLTVVGDIDINLNQGVANGQINKGSFAIIEQVSGTNRQAALFNLKGMTGQLKANFSTYDFELKGQTQTAIRADGEFGIVYVLNPVFYFTKGKYPSIESDEARIVEMKEGKIDIEPWLQNAVTSISYRYLELANNSLPLKGDTEILEDGTPYSILIIKDPEIFSSQFSTMSANKELRQKILEQAFNHGVIPEEEYKLLLERQSVIESESDKITVLGLEPEQYSIASKPSIWATIKGNVTFTKGYLELQSTDTPESYIQLEERSGSSQKSVVVKKYQGKEEYTYTVNGVVTPFDSEAEVWYKNILSIQLQALGASMRLLRHH